MKQHLTKRNLVKATIVVCAAAVGTAGGRNMGSGGGHVRIVAPGPIGHPASTPASRPT